MVTKSLVSVETSDNAGAHGMYDDVNVIKYSPAHTASGTFELLSIPAFLEDNILVVDDIEA